MVFFRFDNFFILSADGQGRCLFRFNVCRFCFLGMLLLLMGQMLLDYSSSALAQSRKPSVSKPALPQFDTSDLPSLKPKLERIKPEQPGPETDLPPMETLVPFETTSPQSKPAEKRPTFQVGVQKTNVLPPEMYGDWSVTATLLDANTLALFAPVVHEIWRLEEAGNAVTLSNPNTGASATVSVDKVDGNQATFHRVQYGPNLKERISETPTLSVNENEMVGVTVNQMDFLRDGHVVKSYRGRYQIQAQRIGRPRVKFGQNRRGAPSFTVQEIGPPESFEIAPIQRQTTPLTFPWLKQ